jgi:hypothetical protein
MIKMESDDRLPGIAETYEVFVVGVCLLWKGEHSLPGENYPPPLPRSKLSLNGFSRGEEPLYPAGDFESTAVSQFWDCPMAV